MSVCVLAYLLRNTIEMMLRQADCMESQEEVMKQLQSCQLNLVGFEGKSSGSSITMTKMTEQQKRLVEIL